MCNLSSGFLLLLFSCSVMSSSFQPHELQHVRLFCPSPSPGACSNFMSIESVIPSNHLILCHPPLLLPSVFPSIKIFSNELTLHIRRPKHCGFSYSISLPTNVQGSRQSLTTDWFVMMKVEKLVKLVMRVE